LSERPADARRRDEAPARDAGFAFEAGFAFVLDFGFAFVVERLRALDFEPPDVVAICSSSSAGVGSTVRADYFSS
jgi:hypothetical protein